jgi:hypothetical protein
MKATGIVLCLLTLVLAGVDDARAQSRIDQSFGGQLSWGFEDEALGLGLRSETRVRPVPVALALSGDYFFPRCGVIGCSLWQLHGNAKLDLGWLLPFDPFLGGGVNYRHFSLRGPDGTARETGTGLNVLAGIWRGRTFVEARYEMMEGIADQLVLSLGFLF